MRFGLPLTSDRDGSECAAAARPRGWSLCVPGRCSRIGIWTRLAPHDGGAELGQVAIGDGGLFTVWRCLLCPAMYAAIRFHVVPLVDSLKDDAP